MKRLLSLALLLVLSCAVYAQKLNSPKNLSVLADEKKLALVIDYTGASILNVDFEDWVEGEPDWEESFANIRVKFSQAFNTVADSGRHPHRVGRNDDVNYKLVIKVIKVRDSGSEVHADVSVVDNNGAIIYQNNMKGENGRFGSVANLMGDAMEDLGTKVGNLFRYSAR